MSMKYVWLFLWDLAGQRTPCQSSERIFKMFAQHRNRKSKKRAHSKENWKILALLLGRVFKEPKDLPMENSFLFSLASHVPRAPYLTIIIIFNFRIHVTDGALSGLFTAIFLPWLSQHSSDDNASQDLQKLSGLRHLHTWADGTGRSAPGEWAHALAAQARHKSLPEPQPLPQVLTFP